MPHKPHTRVLYRLAEPGETIPDGRTIDIRERPGGHAEIIVHPHHGKKRLCDQFTRVSAHLAGHGVWRQRWTDDGRVRRAAQGLMLAVLRWETVPSHMLPTGHVIVPVEDDGSCVFLIDERYCTPQLQNDMNDLQLRIAGDGLWIQCWFRPRPPSAPLAPGPLLAPNVTPLVLA